MLVITSLGSYHTVGASPFLSWAPGAGRRHRGQENTTREPLTHHWLYSEIVATSPGSRQRCRAPCSCSFFVFTRDSSTWGGCANSSSARSMGNSGELNPQGVPGFWGTAQQLQQHPWVSAAPLGGRNELSPPAFVPGQVGDVRVCVSVCVCLSVCVCTPAVLCLALLRGPDGTGAAGTAGNLPSCSMRSDLQEEPFWRCLCSLERSILPVRVPSYASLGRAFHEIIPD